MTSFKNLITIIGIASALAAPASASALAKQPRAIGTSGAMSAGDTGGDGYDCHYIDDDGYRVPLMNGESVIVDGQLVTCKNGAISISTAPGVKTTSTPKPTATPVRK